MPGKKLSVDDAVQKLLTLSNDIELRKVLKKQEEARVDNAFSLIAHGSTRANMRTYLGFLRLVNGKMGLYGVVLCALLVPTVLLLFKDSERLELATCMEARKQELVKKQLQAVEHTYTSKCKYYNFIAIAKLTTNKTSPPLS
ncbi:hypothetical protein QBC36DRAFT_250698 [Triangularia setosa]|uniref:Uncharacterized protein n=1 Tax=Triangularia setosa TaxID=2587417 RepID=A0AAN6VW33_9PEZI|nr:hypothetical protein QBC36DRAFT_250698 [Podospora setosa]